MTRVNAAVGRVEDWGRRGCTSEGEAGWVILVCWRWGAEGEVGLSHCPPDTLLAEQGGERLRRGGQNQEDNNQADESL